MGISTLTLELTRRCLHPRTGSGDPLPQMLLKEGVGTIWGRKVPPSTAGSHEALQTCPPPPGAAVSLRDADQQQDVHWENNYTAWAAQSEHQRSRLIQ